MITLSQLVLKLPHYSLLSTPLQQQIADMMKPLYPIPGVFDLSLHPDHRRSRSSRPLNTAMKRMMRTHSSIAMGGEVQRREELAYAGSASVRHRAPSDPQDSPSLYASA